VNIWKLWIKCVLSSLEDSKVHKPYEVAEVAVFLLAVTHRLRAISKLL